MTHLVGRKVVVTRGGVALASLRTKSIAIANEPIDVTTDDSAGARTLLEESAQHQIDMSVEGLLFDATLVAAAVNRTTLIEEVQIQIEGLGTIAGDFRINSLELGAPYNEATTISAELHSTGDYTFTAES